MASFRTGVVCRRIVDAFPREIVVTHANRHNKEHGCLQKYPALPLCAFELRSLGRRPFHSGASGDAPASSERQYLLSYGQGRPFTIFFFL